MVNEYHIKVGVCAKTGIKMHAKALAFGKCGFAV